jgi:hypothetical protein
MENSDRIDHKPLVDLERVLGSDLVRDRIVAAATDRFGGTISVFPNVLEGAKVF